MIRYCAVLGKKLPDDITLLDNRLHDHPHLNKKNPSDSYVNSVGPNKLTFALWQCYFLMLLFQWFIFLN